jgi:hypothetical protein
MPNAGEFGADSFTHKANDGDGESAPATVSITITRPPACDPVTAADVTLSCTDPEGDTITLELGKKATVIGRLTRSIDGAGQLKGKLTAKPKDALKKALGEGERAGRWRRMTPATRPRRCSGG